MNLSVEKSLMIFVEMHVTQVNASLSRGLEKVGKSRVKACNNRGRRIREVVQA